MPSPAPQTPATISGIDAMRGVGGAPAKGFWADAWERVLRRRTAVFALAWIALVAFFAVFAPVLANGHPLLLETLDAQGRVVSRSSPLLANLSTTDLLLLLGALVGTPFLFLPLSSPRSHRLALAVAVALQAGLVALAGFIVADMGPSRGLHWPFLAVAAGIGVGFVFLLPIDRLAGRIGVAAIVAAVGAAALHWGGRPGLPNYESYALAEERGQARAIYTLVPWSPEQSRTDLYLVPPMTRAGDFSPRLADTPLGERLMVMGSDGIGRDVLSQMLHACRLSISIGFVSTGIAVLIGVTLGALMGYFGGWVDLVLYRVVEVFMAIPVLFLLIVAAAVLPRNTYVMMAIIGCVTWTGAARFTRAEFYRLRGQDFVSAAKALGLPLRSILFRHMLPNGVTPVLVDASFAIAAAILAEATLSYLGLGPEGQASWGKLLSSATNTVGDFVWWLAIFPGAAIFLTVLSYNLIGEALRDAIDPKLRKAGN